MEELMAKRIADALEGIERVLLAKFAFDVAQTDLSDVERALLAKFALDAAQTDLSDAAVSAALDRAWEVQWASRR